MHSHLRHMGAGALNCADRAPKATNRPRAKYGQMEADEIVLFASDENNGRRPVYLGNTSVLNQVVDRRRCLRAVLHIQGFDYRLVVGSQNESWPAHRWCAMPQKI